MSDSGTMFQIKTEELAKKLTHDDIKATGAGYLAGSLESKFSLRQPTGKS